MDVAAGTLVAERYRLDLPLGAGGMGVVWSAWDIAEARPVALKFIRGPVDDPGLRRRFLREGRAAKSIKHDNVVRILDVLDLGDGLPAIVMELLSGESLASKIQREQTIAVPEIARIMLQVVAGVAAAHAKGVVHRDLKPENIHLVPCAGQLCVKVLDFGIAKLTAPEGDAAKTNHATMTGALMGTPCYMAPEQAAGEKDVDDRVDTWSIGIVLYQCISGVLPTTADNVGQVLKYLLTQTIPPLSSAAPDVPADIANIVDRALSRPRDVRPELQDIADVLASHAGLPSPVLPVVSIRPKAPPSGSKETLGKKRIAYADTVPAGTTPQSSPSPPFAATPSATLTTPRGRVARRWAFAAGAPIVVAIGWLVWRGAHGLGAAPPVTPVAPIATSSAKPLEVVQAVAPATTQLEPTPAPSASRQDPEPVRPAKVSKRAAPAPRADVPPAAETQPPPAPAASPRGQSLQGAIVGKPPF